MTGSGGVSNHEAKSYIFLAFILRDAQLCCDFFRREAKKRRVPYQHMIRALVNMYAEQQDSRKGR